MTHWIGKRMKFSMGLSLLLHGLILLLLSISLLPKGERTGSSLSVHLVLRHVDKVESEDGVQPVLSNTAKSKHNTPASEPSLKNTVRQQAEPLVATSADETSQQSVEVATDTHIPQGSPEGIAIPRMITLPWMQGLEVRPVRRPDAPEVEHQMTGEMRARQHAMVQAQLLSNQLKVALIRRLDANGKDISGNCSFTGQGEGVPSNLVCTPVALDALLKSEKPRIVETLLTQSKAGKPCSGLNISFNEGRLGIAFQESTLAAVAPH